MSNKITLIRKVKQGGFTLLEVMLAMAVFAISGVALLGVADNNYRHISHLEEQMFAQWVASNQLVAVSLDKTWPPRNNRKGKVEMAGRTWHWQQKVINTTNKELRAIVMEVRLNEDDELVTASLMTYLAQEKP
ncbi:type II secretion system protein GspI [Colwellia sp. MT41]|uniref:Type II secretion system protein I n=1 Tax=Colwellia marinimaniae TaxID=1513592 RepID=A0ABQ0MXG6_9GAMM|nr:MULTISPECIES: type II secretion system minor pseudopilin GspI [Colwellia]ALO36082.1 type II secretion system protein GspI [Colwellia sp. MT41]GAW97069.1 type II secretion system protein GspI [Colwellia marinimaniae]